MRNIIGGTFVKEGKSSLELTANDLFDKIINLKFTTKNKRTFTIRSDYETVHHKDGTTSFRRCVQKPDIKIEYKQVAESVAIEVNIYITNFFIDGGDKLDKDSMNTASGDPVQWCTIQMGYRAQFSEPQSIEEYYALSRENEMQRGRQIQVQILTGYPQSYPPDRVTYFKGIIGSMETGLRWNHTEADLVQGYGDPQFPQGLSEISAALFQFITRRFIRPSMLHIAKTSEKEADQEIETEQDGKWNKVLLTENGILSVEDAKKYGVLCYTSRTIQNVKANALYGYGYTHEQVETMKPVPSTPFNDPQATIGGQLVSLQQQYPFLRWFILMDGNYYFYHVNDIDEDLWGDPFVKKLQKENTVFLPAIYDMTPSGTRNVRCPFISFLSPLTTVLFQSRFILGTLTSYFYPPNTNAFLVIISDVKFATVQDDNIMELMCVDLPTKEVVFNIETHQIVVRDDNPTDIEIKGNRTFLVPGNMQWTEKTLTVSRVRSNIFETEGRWESIVHNEVLANIRPDRWPAGTRITEKTALEALKKWNPDYFDPNGIYMDRGVSIENSHGIGDRTGIQVPWLATGDKIIVRHPFQSAYPEDERVTSRGR